METIKISVEVSVNLSENTQKFLTSLFAAGVPSGAQVAAQPAKPTPQPAQPVKPAALTDPAPVKPTPQPAAPAQTQSAAGPVPSASKSIEDVRGMLAKNVNEHRDVIKHKLNELGAPSVTKLDPAKYDEMYDFLANLA